MQLTKNLLLSEDMAFAVEKHTYHMASSMSESHYHDHYEMLYVLENERHITVNNRTYVLSSGNIALIAPYTPHRTTAGERTPQTRILVNFKESFIRWLVDKLNIDFLSCFNPASAVVELGEAAGDVRAMLLRLLEVSERAGDTSAEGRSMLILGDILMTLSAITGEYPNTNNPNYNVFLNYQVQVQVLFCKQSKHFYNLHYHKKHCPMKYIRRFLLASKHLQYDN